MAAMTTATLSPAAARAVDPLDFSLADRLPVRPAATQAAVNDPASADKLRALGLTPRSHGHCPLRHLRQGRHRPQEGMDQDRRHQAAVNRAGKSKDALYIEHPITHYVIKF